jgi:hypothetical protein
LWAVGDVVMSACTKLALVRPRTCTALVAAATAVGVSSSTGRFAETGGIVADIGDQTALIADPGEEQLAALRLARVGSDKTIGYLTVDRDGVSRRVAGHGADGVADQRCRAGPPARRRRAPEGVSPGFSR